MRRIIDENALYTQDEYEFNMYCLESEYKEDLHYQLVIEKTDDYDIKCIEFNTVKRNNYFSFTIKLGYI